MSTSRVKTDSSKCIKCGILIRKTTGPRKIIQTEMEAQIVINHTKKDVTIGDVLCSGCRKNIKFTANKYKDEETEMCVAQVSNLSLSFSQSSSSVVTSQSSTGDPTFTIHRTVEDNEQFTFMPFRRTISTHKFCCLCRSTKNIVLVPFEARLQSFIKTRIFIPNGNRCCQNHLIKKRFFEEELRNLRVFSNSSKIEINELSKYLEVMAVRSDSTIFDKVGDLTFSEERLKMFTGLSWENIRQLTGMMTSMRRSESRNITQALVVFLFKLRSGNSNNLIASILELEREQQVSDFCESVMKSFEKDILPFNFGFRSLRRNDLIAEHTSVTAKKLYNIENQLALIFDGTYIRHGKSSNNEYQRKSYSGQKKVPLCKPFTICSTDGYVVEVPGPFYATQNDAEIMRIVMSDPNGLPSLMRKGDICIVDRGFRDVKQYLEEKGYQVLMPALKGKRSQLTTEESNASRMVTKIRWVVEAVHGIIGQKFKLLHHQLDNKLLPKVGLYCRIVCFLNNTFGKCLNSDVGMHDEIVHGMLFPKYTENSLAVEVETKRWARRKQPFQQLSSADLLDFPEITERELKILFTGSYQLGQAVSYLAEMMDEDNNINLQYAKAQNNIIKVLVQSRHIGRKVYKCFIHYQPNAIGCSGILRYTCECANGLRTVGCCSHVAAIIYYLSHARYLSKIIRPAEILSCLFEIEEVNPVIDDDSDED